MTVPNITDMIVWDGTPFDNDDWDANANQLINFLSDGTYDLIVNSVKANNGFDANGAKIINVGNGTDPGDAVNFSQLQNTGVPDNYITGLVPSNNSTDSEHDIDFSVGTCKDSTNTSTLISTVSLTKQIDANWALGTDQGGFPSGLTLTADTWYHMFIISKSDGTIDYGFDSDLTASNLLSDATDFIFYRRVGSVLVDASSNIINGIWYRKSSGALSFIWNIQQLDYNANAPTSSGNVTVSSPLGVNCEITANVTLNQRTVITEFYLVTRNPDTTDVVPAITNSTIYTEQDNGGLGRTTNQSQLLTNTSSQIALRANLAYLVSISVIGYTDERIA